jgi:hypothetical protein
MLSTPANPLNPLRLLTCGPTRLKYIYISRVSLVPTTHSQFPSIPLTLSPAAATPRPRVPEPPVTARPCYRESARAEISIPRFENRDSPPPPRRSALPSAAQPPPHQTLGLQHRRSALPLISCAVQCRPAVPTNSTIQLSPPSPVTTRLGKYRTIS